MLCPNCGTQVADEAAFCPSCGQNLTPVDTIPPASEPIAPPPLPSAVTAPPPPPPPPVPTVEPPPFVAPAPVTADATVVAAPTATGEPYPKAPLGSRFLAVLVDGIIASALLAPGILIVYAGLASGDSTMTGALMLALGVIWELAYSLGRDGFGGAGFGKRLVGLVVVSSSTGAPSGLGASFARQGVLWLLNLIPAVGSIIEPIMVISDKDGRRLGDKAAKTQVARAAAVVARGHRVAAGKGAAIAALVVALLISIVGSAVGGIVFARAVAQASDPILIEEPVTNENGSGTEPIDPVASGEPQDAASAVIDDFYAAVAAGDFEAVTSTLSQTFAAGADPGMFEGWTAPGYEILSTTPQDDGTILIEVQETDGGLANGLVTFVLADEGGWKIDYWLLGGLDDQPSPEPSTQLLNPESASDAVGALITALQNDDVAAMKALVTKNFLQTDPTFFRPTNGVLTDFAITDVYQDGGTYIVVTSESWPSGPEPMSYVVVEQDGKILVDGWLQ